MKKTACCLLLSLIAVIPSTAFALVRLKNVTQSGLGNLGTVKIELNGDYDRSKIKISYESDHLALIMNDAFVMPVKKIFKSSSPKSSILKMEANMVPSTKKSGGTVKLNIYFRVPIETIKKTGALSGSGKIITFNYKMVGDAKEATTGAIDKNTEPVNKEVSGTESSTTVKTEKNVISSIPTTGIQDNGDQAVKTDPSIEAKTKEVESKITDSGEKGLLGHSSFRTLIFKFIKIAGGLLGVIVLLFLALFFFKKRSEQKTQAPVYKQPSMPNETFLRPASSNTGSIKILSSSVLEDDKKLYIIEIYGERMLIGTSKNSIAMITKINDKEQQMEDLDHEQESIMRSRLKDKLRNL